AAVGCRMLRRSPLEQRALASAQAGEALRHALSVPPAVFVNANQDRIAGAAAAFSPRHPRIAPAPAALARYAPSPARAGVLREARAGASAAVERRLQSMLAANMLCMERQVHTQVIHEISHGSQTHEQLRKVVGDTLFSPKTMAQLVERIDGAIARRSAIERYRRGGR
ncbi:hypothetical protein ACO0LM_01500, partial [Undibacterium sp. Di26W]|uniref:hypothetical protein n=1 Tax=Undibacterium sp. Di26W TaxID=3413035 RepID=UPI003BEFBE13